MEHVVAFENDIAVEFDSGVGIQTVERQHAFAAIFVQCGLDWQGCSVGPGFLAYPLDVYFIEAKKRIRYSVNCVSLEE